MYFLEPLVLNVSQAIGLVPTRGEDIKRYLSTNGAGEAIVGELLPQDFYEGGTDTMDLWGHIRDCASSSGRSADLVVGFKLVTFQNPRTRLVERGGPRG